SSHPGSGMPAAGPPPPPGLPKFPPQRMSGDVSSMRSSLASSHGPPISAPSHTARPGSISGESSLSHGKEVSRSANSSIAEATRGVNSKPEGSKDLEESNPKQLQAPKQSRGRSTTVQERRQPSTRSRSLEAIANFIFRRGRSQDPKNDEAKQMIIDTEKPPKFDPVTGRYLFEETEEEKKAAEMVRAGPPKPSSMKMKGPAPSTGGSSGPQSMLRPPSGPTGMLRASSNGPPRAQYVDMFNTT
ncbi:uncharacterized protein TM35_000092400, partial [Trypanosoma theileri]